MFKRFFLGGFVCATGFSGECRECRECCEWCEGEWGDRAFAFRQADAVAAP
jgi:hypothetical protein